MIRGSKGNNEYGGAWGGFESILAGNLPSDMHPKDVSAVAAVALSTYLERDDVSAPVRYRFPEDVDTDKLTMTIGVMLAANSLLGGKDHAIGESARKFSALTTNVAQDRLASLVWGTVDQLENSARKKPNDAETAKRLEIMREFAVSSELPIPQQKTLTLRVPVPEGSDLRRVAATALTVGTMSSVVAPSLAAAQPTQEMVSLSSIQSTQSPDQGPSTDIPVDKTMQEKIEALAKVAPSSGIPKKRNRANAVTQQYADLHQPTTRKKDELSFATNIADEIPVKTSTGDQAPNSNKQTYALPSETMQVITGLDNGMTLRLESPSVGRIIEKTVADSPEESVKSIAANAVPMEVFGAGNSNPLSLLAQASKPQDGDPRVAIPQTPADNAVIRFRALVDALEGSDIAPAQSSETEQAAFSAVVQKTIEAAANDPKNLDDGKPAISEVNSFTNIVSETIAPPAPSSPETPTPNSSADQQQSPSQNVPVHPSMEVAKNQSAISYDFAKLPGDYATEKARDQAKSITEKLQNSALHREVYLQVAKEMGVDPEIIATLHWRETSMNLKYLSNGQGLFQDYGNRGKYPRKGTATKEEFIEQSKWAVNHLAEKIGKENLHKLNHADPEFDLNLVREAFLKYNGLGGSLYRRQAGEKARYYGSPYVMNLYSDEYDSKKNPNWKQFLSDGGNVGPANQAIGATTLYEALIAISNFGIAPAPAPAQAPESTPPAQATPNAPPATQSAEVPQQEQAPPADNENAKIAAELGVKLDNLEIAPYLKKGLPVPNKLGVTLSDAKEMAKYFGLDPDTVRKEDEAFVRTAGGSKKVSIYLVQISKKFARNDKKRHINIRHAGAHIAFTKAAREKYGIDLRIGSSFRFNWEQIQFRKDANCKDGVVLCPNTGRGKPKQVALPGRSRHQTGYAVDYSIGMSILGWDWNEKLKPLAAEHGLVLGIGKRGGGNGDEAWHAVPSPKYIAKAEANIF